MEPVQERQILAGPRSTPLRRNAPEKYGYDSMHQFRNWRWYKKYGGGPIVDLGTHQIDIFSWVFQTNRQVGDRERRHRFLQAATSGTTTSWPSSSMTAPTACTRAFYQVLTTTSNGGFYESFRGENGTLVISEVPPRGGPRAPRSHRAGVGAVREEGDPAAGRTGPEPKAKTRNTAIDVRVSPEPGKWPLPSGTEQAGAPAAPGEFLRGDPRPGIPLNCPGEVGIRDARSPTLKVNDAVEAGTKLYFQPEEFRV